VLLPPRLGLGLFAVRTVHDSLHPER
jgi:hypothetical protein